MEKRANLAKGWPFFYKEQAPGPQVTAKAENCFSNFLPLQIGQLGFWLPCTRASNAWSHAVHRYS
jgi:hypothetical protein